MQAGPSPRPAVGPAPAGGGARPFCTVALPSYNPDEAYFEATLRSVLDQDPGPDLMEILVSDDRSTSDTARRVADRLAPGRVAFHANHSNLGLAGNWNACIGHARGRWVHILHTDDLIRPGFYEAIARAEQLAPEAGMFCCQNAFINEQGRWTSIAPLVRPGPGLVDHWLETICEEQLLQCPAVAVRRDVYERVGGFRADLLFVVDWEMWVRIAADAVPCWYEPEVLACYRVHGGAETARLNRAGRDIEDVRRGIGIVRDLLPAPLRSRAGRGMLRYMSTVMLDRSTRAIQEGSMKEGLQLLHEACRLDPSLRFESRLLTYYRWVLVATIRRAMGGSPGSTAGVAAKADR